MLNKLWKDEDGIVALEYLLIATVVGLALVVGFSALSTGLNTELTELANAIMGLDQSYSVDTVSNCNSSKTGSTITDSTAGVVGFSSSTTGNSTTTVSISACP